MRRLAASTALVLATLAGIAILWELRGAVLIFFLSLGTSAALRPMIEQLHRWGLPKSLALGVTYLGCVVAFFGLALALVFPLAADLHQLGHDTKAAYDDISTNWPKGNALERTIAQRLPSWDDLQRLGVRAGTDAAKDVSAAKTEPANQDQQADPLDQTESGIASWWAHRAVHTLLGVTWGFFGSILNVLIIVVLSLYWSIDRVHFERLWLSLLDVGRRQRSRETWRAIENATGAYLQREAVQSLSAGCLLGCGFWLLQQPYPVLSAAVGALAWLIPWVGAPLAMIAVTAIWLPRFMLVSGEGALVMLAAASLYTLLVLMLLEWLVEPRLFRRKRYNPILLVLVGVGMVDSLGFLGLLLAPPIAAAIQILGAQYLAHRTAAALSTRESSPSALAERLSTLRARMADAAEVSAETQNAVNRLDELVEQARHLLEPPTAARLTTGLSH
ncbi:MAG TPA: AI-2E family transporter [Pirellulales bacterium]|nr:AI-2E family transporter [Pirellulales bacterium]